MKPQTPPNSDFMDFRLQQMNPNLTKRNDIYYKGQKIYKYQAFQKFGSYQNMMADKNIKIVTINN